MVNLTLGNGKGKFHPRTGHEGSEGEQRYNSTLSLASVLDVVGGQRHAQVALPRERLGNNCIGSWVGPRAVLGRCGKSDADHSPSSSAVAKKEYSYTSIPTMGLRPVQSLSACTRVQFTFTFT